MSRTPTILPGPQSHDERAAVGRRLTAALGTLSDVATPLVMVDLDAFDANADDLVRRAGGTPIRVASKSLRVPALVQRLLSRPGFAGVLAYSLREALWLAESAGVQDVVMGYPSVDRGALTRLLDSRDARARITLMVDCPAHLNLIAGLGEVSGVRIAIDVDAGLRLGPAHVGPKRSPLHTPEAVVSLARHAQELGFVVVGVMTYEGQVAGVPDDVPGERARSAIIRRLKAASIDQLPNRRASIVKALSQITDLEFWNAGGSGSIESSAADPVVTEVAAGSGLLVPGLFDHYRSFAPRPAAYFGVPVVRRPSPSVATVAGGGFIASGTPGANRAPLPWAPPGLEWTSLEGVGEVQTPLTGPGANRLRVGDWVWFRHAKSGELMEHTNLVHLVQGESVVESVPSYRGLGHAW